MNSLNRCNTLSVHRNVMAIQKSTTNITLLRCFWDRKMNLICYLFNPLQNGFLPRTYRNVEATCLRWSSVGNAIVSAEWKRSKFDSKDCPAIPLWSWTRDCPHRLTVPSVSFQLQFSVFFFFNNSFRLSDLSERHCNTSAIALINGNIPWDMHRPLAESSTLQLLNFHVADPHVVNRAFWRSCSFLLGAALQQSVKDVAGLQLHSFPSPNVKSGSFVHDISLAQKGWLPSAEELRAISAEMIRLAARRLKIERLEVGHDLALEMFKDNPYKREQLPSISKSGSVVLYRVGQHVDISRGPMIANTSFLGKCTVSSVHQVAEESESMLYRVQGVALPTGFIVNHVAYGILEDRSRKPVSRMYRFISDLLLIVILFFFLELCSLAQRTIWWSFDGKYDRLVKKLIVFG